ncbi:MAG: methyltransferase [Propionibacteriaceae bacterium]|nr:methyltransferase [Propionibacteriaceae bacterium]
MSGFRSVMDQLRAVFLEEGFSADQVIEAIGQSGQADLSRNHTFGAHVALEGRDDGLATLIRLFVLQASVPSSLAASLLPLQALQRLELVDTDGRTVRARVDIRPFDDQTDGTDGWVVSDHAASVDGHLDRSLPDHVLGVSPASVSLAQITDRRLVGSALDLGTGSGIQAIHLARHAGQVVATDLSRRALDLASLTFALNDLKVELCQGSLYEPVDQRSFDLICSNPPYVIAPPTKQRLVYREGAFEGDGLMQAVITGAAQRLNSGGSLHVVGNWAHCSGQDWAQRLSSWMPAGCQGFFVERERLDVFEYIEIWLADAGLIGQPDYQEQYQRWLDYFAALRIEAVGLGWLTMVKTGRPTRSRSQSWPFPVAQPVADDLMAHIQAMNWSDWSDEQMLAAHWTLADNVSQELIAPIGVADPQAVILRRHDGLARAIEADAALAGVLGACDGELSLESILVAVAQLLDLPAAELTTQVLDQVRKLVADTWLTPGVTKIDGRTGVEAELADTV